MADFIPDDEFVPDSVPTPAREPAAAAPTQSVASPAFISDGDFVSDEDKYGNPVEQVKTLAEGVGKGLAGPVFTGAETAFLGNEKEQLARQEANPITHGAGELTGLVGGALVAPEVTLGGLLPKAGALGAEALGLGAIAAGQKAFTAAKAAGATLEAANVAKSAALAGYGTIAKIGSAIVGSAIENMVYQGSDEVSKMILKDPSQSADTAVASMGLAGLIGGAFGTISPLWHATMGKPTGGILGAVADKLGGIEGAASTPAEAALDKSGIQVAPEMRTLVSENPAVQQMARTMMQTDTNASGLEMQKAYKEMTKNAGDSMAAALGKTPEELSAMPELSKAEAGTAIGKTLAKEYETQINPFAQGFDEVKSKLKGIELEPSVADKSEDAIANQSKLQTQLDKATRAAVKARAAGDPGVAIEAAAKVQDITNAMKAAKDAAERPGTVDSILDKISKRAMNEGWASSPSSDIMHEVNRITKELPLQKNLRNLGDYITQVGNSTNKDPMNGPLRRAGGIITSIMKDAEADAMATHIGSEAGPDAVEHLRALQEGYRVQSALKEGIADRLGARHGSTSGYADVIREMARTDAEGVLRKLSGKGDADWLKFVQTHYPETAAAIRKYHANELLERAVSKAKEGASIDNATLLKDISNMPKELRDFVIPTEAQQHIETVGTALEGFKNPTHNFSNTARTASSLLKDFGPTAMGAATALSGHGLGAGALVGVLGKTVGKEVPDAIRLSLLRFLGSNQPIEAGAFKTMVDYIHHTIKGETLLSNATKNIFKAGSEVIPAHLMPKEKDRERLKTALSDMQEDPEKAMSMTGKAGYYLPTHAAALAQTGAAAVTLLNAIKPNTDSTAPLDTMHKPNPTQKAQYNRALDIAQQPLMVFKHIANGTLTPGDVQIVKATYPGLYARSIEKLTDQIATMRSKGATIPYKTRMGLSLYMGRALDSTMQAASIMAAQPMPPQAQPQTATQPASNPKRSTASLSKMPKMYQTATQSAERDRMDRK